MCNARRLGPCERSEQRARSGFTWATANAVAEGLATERQVRAAGVGGRPSEDQGEPRSSYRICLAVHGTKRRGLASLDLPRTSADEGLASGASEARGGGRS
ncbi:hypothetical protein TYRP_003913, partial [Tyrophagus putrescentiae]